MSQVMRDENNMKQDIHLEGNNSTPVMLLSYTGASVLLRYATDLDIYSYYDVALRFHPRSFLSTHLCCHTVRNFVTFARLNYPY